MFSLLNPLEKLEAYHLAKDQIKRKQTPIAIYGAIDSQKCHIISGLSDHKQKVIVTYNDVRAREIYDDMKFFEKDVFFVPFQRRYIL